MIEPGTILSGKYKILEKIGMGGMGAVFKAQDLDFDVERSVAIKVLPAHLAADEKLVKRFREEINILARLEHPNIVPIYTIGEEGEIVYYVMKYLRGDTLKGRIRHRGTLSPEQVTVIMIQISRAVDYIHRAGAIHRDIKSVNIMLDEQDNATLMDFGIAKIAGGANLTADGEVLGTAPYMAPEQWEGLNDPRSDIYALGILMYEMLAGAPPFAGDSISEIMVAHLRKPPTPLRSVRPQVPEALAQVVHCCLAKNPDDRYATAADLCAALEFTDRTIHTESFSTLNHGDREESTLVMDAEELKTAAESTGAAKKASMTATGKPENPTVDSFLASLGKTPVTETAGAEQGGTVAETATLPPRGIKYRRLALIIGIALIASLLIALATSFILGKSTSKYLSAWGDAYFEAGMYRKPLLFNATTFYGLAVRYDQDNKYSWDRLDLIAQVLAQQAVQAFTDKRYQDAVKQMKWALQIDNRPEWRAQLAQYEAAQP